ncbi:uncharacterized protein [Argopecten irradians]|uniref:uncharacterized protein n=1 Tax=Argopecten irradians TaxID=31199 RepID=UPI0037167C45
MLAKLILISIFTATFSSDVYLSPVLRDAIDKYLSQKLRQFEEKRNEDVKRLTDRVKELEESHSMDMQIVTKRLQDAEDQLSDDARLFDKRMQEMKMHHAKELQAFSQRLQEMEAFVKDTGVISTPLEDKNNTEDIAILSNDIVHLSSREEGSRSISMSNRALGFKREHADRTLTKPSPKRDVVFEKENIIHLPFDSDIGVRLPGLVSPDRTQRVVPPENGVAFHALLQADVVNPTKGHIIQFQNIKTNIGNTYHPTTGVFTCPRSGIYVFSWSLRINHGPGHGINSEIVHNGVAFGYSAVGSGGSDDVFSESSATVSVQLVQGDEVWVRINSLYVGTNILSVYSMFTGFLVHENSS